MNKTKSLSKLRRTGFLIGLNVALICVYAAFNYTVQMKPSTASEHIYGPEPAYPPLQPEPKSEPKPVDEPPTNPKNTKVKIGDEDPRKDEKQKEKPSEGPLKLMKDTFGEDPPEKITFEKIDDKTIYTDVTENAVFTHGDVSAFIGSKIQVPGIAREIGLQGTILLEFVVEKDGSVSMIRILTPRKRQLGYGVEQAAIKAVRFTSGLWKAAGKEGRKVRSYFRIPIEVDFSSGF